MEQYFENEKTYVVFMNEVMMEDEPLQEFEKNVSVQRERNKNPKTHEKQIKTNLKKLHA
jgi:hypothetical protein